jgi:hypothetical protein
MSAQRPTVETMVGWFIGAMAGVVIGYVLINSDPLGYLFFPYRGSRLSGSSLTIAALTISIVYAGLLPSYPTASLARFSSITRSGRPSQSSSLSWSPVFVSYGLTIPPAAGGYCKAGWAHRSCIIRRCPARASLAFH